MDFSNGRERSCWARRVRELTNNKKKIKYRFNRDIFYNSFKKALTISPHPSGLSTADKCPILSRETYRASRIFAEKVFISSAGIITSSAPEIIRVGQEIFSSRSLESSLAFNAR